MAQSRTQTAAATRRRPAWLLILLLVLSVVLALLFARSFVSGQALHSNDGPYGLQTIRALDMPDAFVSMWHDLNWLGTYWGSFVPNPSSLTRWLFGPLGYTNFGPPLAFLIAGLCAALFFRMLRFPGWVCVLGAIAAALNGNFFSNGCWGLPSRSLSLAMAFLALAAVEVGARVQPILCSIVAGFAIGLSITEGGDNGAIFSMFIAAYAFYRAIAGTSSPGKGAAIGVAKVVVMALCAGILASSTLEIFVRTSVKGVVGTEQDSATKAQKWDFATQWSLPKVETLRAIIPGLFGYRMDTPEGGQYWGGVGRYPAVDEFAKRLDDPDPNVRQQAAGILSNPGVWRSSGAGEYTGILVILIAAWGIADSLRKKGSAFSDLERRLIWAWAILAVVAVLLSWGRHAPFYKAIYALPYFSTIRNPMKFMHPFNLCAMVLFAYGLTSLHRRYLKGESKKSSVMAHFTAWWRSGSGFEKSWTWACLLFVALSALGWITFSGSRKQVVNYLMSAGFGSVDAANSIARFSSNEILLYLLFLSLSVGLLILVLSGAFTGRRAMWAIVGLGTILTIDLARANLPWIIYYDWKTRLASNPVLDTLRTNPMQHRVTMPQFQAGQQFGMLQNFYHAEWLQHQFPFHGIQSLDMPQEPRMPADKQAYRTALSTNIARLWQLTNTRYVFGMGGEFVSALNGQLDPEKRRFRQHMLFTLFQKPGTEFIGAETNTTGPFGLYEFTGALPRTRLYNNWEIIPDEKELLTRLGNPAWNPEETVLISTADAPKPTAAASSVGTAEIVANPSPKVVEIKTAAESPSMLLLNDKIEPEWKAYIDGKPADVYRANYLVRGVHIPAGQHKVEFRYEMKPTGLYVVLACELVGLLLLGCVILSARKKREAELSASTSPAP